MSDPSEVPGTSGPQQHAKASTVKIPGVRRMNRLPVLVAVGAMAVFLGVMTLALVQRTAITGDGSGTDSSGRRSAGDAAEALITGQPDGIISADTPAPAADGEATPVSTPAATTETPVEPDRPAEPDDRSRQYARRIADYEAERELQRMQLHDRMETDAWNSPTSLGLQGLEKTLAGRNGTPAPQQPPAAWGTTIPGISTPGPDGSVVVGGVEVGGPPSKPMNAAEALAAIRGVSGAGGDQSNQAGKQAFLASAGSAVNSDRLSGSIEDPLSPYELKQGSVIPGVLISGINSDLPGRIIGQVSRNVYDTATGRYLLIPQGTRIFGRYDSDVSFGQERVLVAWTRLIFPDGSAINIERMAGSDEAGAGGFQDRVNNHWFRTLKSALLISVIGAGVEKLTESRDEDDVADAIRSSFGETFSSVARQSVSRSLNVQPTIEIRPGYRFLIVVDKDMILKPWKQA